MLVLASSHWPCCWGRMGRHLGQRLHTSTVCSAETGGERSPQRDREIRRRREVRTREGTSERVNECFGARLGPWIPPGVGASHTGRQGLKKVGVGGGTQRSRLERGEGEGPLAQTKEPGSLSSGKREHVAVDTVHGKEDWWQVESQAERGTERPGRGGLGQEGPLHPAQAH